jgi:transposase
LDRKAVVFGAVERGGRIRASVVQKGYTHRRIKHHARVYVDGDVHTQTIDGFFGLFKTGVRGAHHAVSHKWLQGYLNEWPWRYNRRESETPMFTDLLNEAARRV